MAFPLFSFPANHFCCPRSARGRPGTQNVQGEEPSLEESVHPTVEPDGLERQVGEVGLRAVPMWEFRSVHPDLSLQYERSLPASPIPFSRQPSAVSVVQPDHLVGQRRQRVSTTGWRLAATKEARKQSHLRRPAWTWGHGNLTDTQDSGGSGRLVRRNRCSRTSFDRAVEKANNQLVLRQTRLRLRSPGFLPIGARPAFPEQRQVAGSKEWLGGWQTGCGTSTCSRGQFFTPSFSSFSIHQHGPHSAAARTASAMGACPATSRTIARWFRRRQAFRRIPWLPGHGPGFCKSPRHRGPLRQHGV